MQLAMKSMGEVPFVSLGTALLSWLDHKHGLVLVLYLVALCVIVQLQTANRRNAAFAELVLILGCSSINKNPGCDCMGILRLCVI